MSKNFFDGTAWTPVKGDGLRGFWNKDHAKPGPVTRISFPTGMSVPEGFSGNLVVHASSEKEAPSLKF